MELGVTLAAAVALLAGAAACGWRGARPWDPSGGPRLLPWRFLMLTLGFGVLLMLAHAVNLIGFTTGSRLGAPR